jgi:hypothetical protein
MDAGWMASYNDWRALEVERREQNRQSRSCRKRAFNWTSRERFPSASTVGADLGERLLAQRFPVFC